MAVNCMLESDVMRKALKQKEKTTTVKRLSLIKAFSTIQLKFSMMIFHLNFIMSLTVKEPVEISHHQVNLINQNQK